MWTDGLLQTLHWMLKRLSCSQIHPSHFSSFSKLTTTLCHPEHIVSGRKAFHSSASHFRAQVSVKFRKPSAMTTEYLTQKGQNFDRPAFESLLKRKTFLWQSFEPYGAVKVGLSVFLLFSYLFLFYHGENPTLSFSIGSL